MTERCPYCSSETIELLPGGVVYECLECEHTFTKSEVKTSPIFTALNAKENQQ